MAEATTGTSISPQRAAELISSAGAIVIDCREPDEHEAGRIAEARNIPLADLTAAAESIDRDRPVIVHCRGGSRSAMAADALREAGWDAHSIEGGLRGWVQEGLPIEPEDGQVLESRLG